MILKVLKTLHTRLEIYYAYLVSASIALQETWGQLDDYVPKHYRHAVLGVATVVVVGNHIYTAVKATKATPAPPA